MTQEGLIMQRAAWLFVRVVGLDKVFGDIAASGNSSFGSRHPFGLTENRPQFIEKVILAPIPASDRML